MNTHKHYNINYNYYFFTVLLFISSHVDAILKKIPLNISSSIIGECVIAPTQKIKLSCILGLFFIWGIIIGRTLPTNNANNIEIINNDSVNSIYFYGILRNFIYIFFYTNPVISHRYRLYLTGVLQ